MSDDDLSGGDLDMAAYEEVQKAAITACNAVFISSDPVSPVKDYYYDDDDDFSPAMDIDAWEAAEAQALTASSSSVVEPFIAITVQSPSSPPPPVPEQPPAAAVVGSAAHPIDVLFAFQDG